MIAPDQPAFPEVHIHHFITDAHGEQQPAVLPRWHGGLTKREYLAAMAIQGIMFWDATVNEPHETGKIEALAAQAVNMADALIAELSK